MHEIVTPTRDLTKLVQTVLYISQYFVGKADFRDPLGVHKPSNSFDYIR